MTLDVRIGVNGVCVGKMNKASPTTSRADGIRKKLKRRISTLDDHFHSLSTSDRFRCVWKSINDLVPDRLLKQMVEMPSLTDIWKLILTTHGSFASVTQFFMGSKPQESCRLIFPHAAKFSGLLLFSEVSRMRTS